MLEFDEKKGKSSLSKRLSYSTCLHSKACCHSLSFATSSSFGREGIDWTILTLKLHPPSRPERLADHVIAQYIIRFNWSEFNGFDFVFKRNEALSPFCHLVFGHAVVCLMFPPYNCIARKEINRICHSKTQIVCGLRTLPDCIIEKTPYLRVVWKPSAHSQSNKNFSFFELSAYWTSE